MGVFRDVLASAQVDTPPNSYPICLLHNVRLHLDLSLAHQSVKGSDVLYVVFRKCTAPQRGQIPRSRSASGFEEALRVSDVAFLCVDSSQRPAVIYQAMFEEQDETDFDDEAQSQVLTVTDEAPGTRTVSDAPLPQCWSRGPDQLATKSVGRVPVHK
jgi:hypothetical protein